jgi:hypothetical protein
MPSFERMTGVMGFCMLSSWDGEKWQMGRPYPTLRKKTLK